MRQLASEHKPAAPNAQSSEAGMRLTDTAISPVIKALIASPNRITGP